MEESNGSFACFPLLAALVGLGRAADDAGPGGANSGAGTGGLQSGAGPGGSKSGAGPGGSKSGLADPAPASNLITFSWIDLTEPHPVVRFNAVFGHCCIIQQQSWPISFSRIQLTVEHILIHSIDFDLTRQMFFNVASLYDLFQNVQFGKVLEFLKTINFYRQF
jgi:hypothetical protein